MRILLTTFLACLTAWSATAATWYSDGSPWNTQSNITLHASTGDFVIGTNGGTFSCTSNITFSIPLSLYFTNVTWQDDAVDTGNDNTRSCLWLNTSGNSLYRVSGLVIDQGTRSTQYFDAGSIRVTGQGTAVRIDSCSFKASKNIGIGWYGPFGVVDHCIFDAHASFVQPAKLAHDSFLGVGSFGDNSWATGPMYGTSNFLFFEDCFFTNRSGAGGLGIDAQGGGRYVVRYSILDRIILGGHGTETTQRERGIRTREFYKNLIVNHSDSEVGHFRSGSGVIWSNTVQNSSAFFTVRAYRLTTPTTPWGYANGITNWDSNDPTLFDSGTATSGGGLGVLVDSTKSWTINQWQGYSLWDSTQNKASYVLTNSATVITFDTQDPAAGTPLTVATSDSYQLRKVIHILDSPGRGAGDLVSNSTPVVNGIAQWPNQALDPIYTWSNSFSSVSFPNISNSGVQGSQYPIVNGQEIQNNTFLTGYVPYTYPHPLVTPPTVTDPAITSQPGNQTVFVGQVASFSVTATGTPTLTYQWSKNGSTIAGATQSLYTTPATVSGDNGSTFYVDVTSGAGGPLRSSTATLTVNPDPGITVQPQNQSVTVGQTATFTITASGATTLHYAWTFNGGSVGTDSASYARSNCQLSDSGGSVQCVVSDTAGNVTSSTATLTVTGGGGSPVTTTDTVGSAFIGRGTF